MASMSLLFRLLLRAALNIALVWALGIYLPDFFVLTGGWYGIVIVGLLLTILNMLLRPLLDLITLPLRLFASLLAFLVVNGVFLWLTISIVQRLQPTSVTLHIVGGAMGWLVVVVVFGLANWIMRLIVR